ncbi:hypothetical protein [Nocardioides aquiterrae]|uniref:Netrin module non-TIMP type domain-containing protein n=1 Tax=Nocardioides aquiterrae TaxID=203799 RepID=A0ABN1UM83_9ACTN
MPNRLLGRLLGRLLALVLLVGGVVAATGTAASACPQLDSSPAALAKRADQVFTGTVADRTRQGPGIHYAVDVERVYKGDVGAQASLTTPRSPRACGEPGLEKGREYVFFVSGGHIDVHGAAPATDARVARVERLLGPGTSPTPAEPAHATLSLVAGEPTTLARLAAPGVALVIVGLLGLLLVAGLGRRRS